MEITWYGHACFRLRDRDITIVTDPYGEDVGYPIPRLRAHVVTVSHDHHDHNNVEAVKGDPLIIDGPGEYECRGVFITGIPTYHDSKKGQQRGSNTVFLFEFEDLAVCHLGDLGHVPTQAQVEALSDVAVLLIPVGSVYTIGAAQAAEVVSLLEPKIVIPMHHRTEMGGSKLQSVRQFLKELGLSKVPTMESLKVTKSTLPEETQVMLLDYQH